MTLVIGRQFFNRLVILSDTMISDEASTGTNIIPGRLKSIVLSQDIAVSFSGLANQACGTIRRLYGHVLKGLNLPSLLESLRNSTQMFNGEVSFLLACRVPKLALYKVSDGQVNSGSDRYWIGDPRAASEVQRIMEIEEEHIHAKLKDDEFFSPAEVAFTAAFMSLVLEQRIPGVGGICFNCLGSEHGFCYQNVAEMYAWDPILIGAGFDPEARRAFERTGTTHYTYSTLSSQDRGVAVTGVFFQQADLGYVYSPLDPDLNEPTKFHPITLEELAEKVHDYGKKLATEV